MNRFDERRKDIIKRLKLPYDHADAMEPHIFLDIIQWERLDPKFVHRNLCYIFYIWTTLHPFTVRDDTGIFGKLVGAVYNVSDRNKKSFTRKGIRFFQRMAETNCFARYVEFNATGTWNAIITIIDVHIESDWFLRLLFDRAAECAADGTRLTAANLYTVMPRDKPRRSVETPPPPLASSANDGIRQIQHAAIDDDAQTAAVISASLDTDQQLVAPSSPSLVQSHAAENRIKK